MKMLDNQSRSYSWDVDATQLVIQSPTAWLDNCIIDYGQALLKTQYSQIAGLHTTTSLTLLGQSPVSDQRFVQILHLDGDHWITITNVLSPEDTVYVYDSLTPRSNAVLEAQLASFSRTTKTKITALWYILWLWSIVACLRDFPVCWNRFVYSSIESSSDEGASHEVLLQRDNGTIYSRDLCAI